LQEIGRRTWAEEEFARLEATRWTKERDSEDAFLRIKGAKALSLRQRAVLRAVHRWRDGLARELDRAPFRVLPNETLVALARRQPRSEVELTRVSGLSHHRMDRYGQSLLEAISVGLQASLDTVPEVRRHARPERDAGYDARLERLRALRAKAAQDVGLDSGLVCPNGTLQVIARLTPGSSGDLDGVAELRRWQRAILGDDALLAAVRDEP
jgi:ribonuclease D